MTDFVERLARKWCFYDELAGKPGEHEEGCYCCLRLAAAIREALEEAEKITPKDRLRTGTSARRGDGMSLDAHDHGNCNLCDAIDQEITRLRAEVERLLTQRTLLVGERETVMEQLNKAEAVIADLKARLAKHGESV